MQLGEEETTLSCLGENRTRVINAIETILEFLNNPYVIYFRTVFLGILFSIVFVVNDDQKEKINPCQTV